jgi:hypothetical protein
MIPTVRRVALGISPAIGAMLAVCVGLAATQAVAASTRHERTKALHSTYRMTQHRSARHIVAQRPFEPGYGGSTYRLAPVGQPVGWGFVGESCDLPTSPCPNDLRITN